jgi:AraC-like DNA-binding protein
MERTATAGILIGRDAPWAVLDKALASVRDGGRALWLRGEAGMGKTALLEKVAAAGTEGGLRVLRVSGTEQQAALAFGVLQQLVRALSHETDALTCTQRLALRRTLGTDQDRPRGGPAAATAVLALLTQAATKDKPLLLVVDDLQWVDASSAKILAFIQRRLARAPIVMAAGIRSGMPACPDSTGAQVLDLAPLTDTQAAELLDLRHPDLSLETRNRLVREAAGNPLALIELPARRKTQHRPGHLPRPMGGAHTADIVGDPSARPSSGPVAGQVRKRRTAPSAAGLDVTPRWQNSFDAHIAPARIHWRTPPTGEPEVVAQRLGYVNMLSLKAGPLRVSRSPRFIDRFPVHRVAMAVQQAGTATLTQDGRSATLQPGDLAFIDVRRPFSLEQRSRFQSLILSLPEQALGLGPERAVYVTGRAIGPEAGAARLLVPFLHQLRQVAGQVSPAVADLLAGNTVEFVALLADEVFGEEESLQGSARDHLVPLIRRYIDQNLSDPSLSPERVAEAHHISVRYLHRLFEGEGVTVGRLIRQRRVEECGRELARRGRASPTISAVALRWGFQSPAHFSRAFKELFGMAPRQWRSGENRSRPLPAAPASTDPVPVPSVHNSESASPASAP